MHELGIVFHTIDLVEKVGRENGLARVTKVTMRLGEVSGVVPELLADCWRWAAARSELLEGCELEIVPVEAVTVCNACGKTYPTLKHGRICPFCESEDTVLLAGNEMEIVSVETPE